MVGDAIAREMVLPDIVTEMRVCERNLFHLDGTTALRHLDLLLSLPRLDAVQWVYGEGHGPASRWIDVYRRIVNAGKSVQVIATDAQDALQVLRAIGPQRVWLCVGKPFSSRGESDAFLHEVGQFRGP